MIGDAAYADSKCPAPKASNDPFADLDDVMTEEEKRQALHLDLKRKLSSHNSSCPPSSKTTKANSSANSGQSAGSSSSTGQQNSGQGSGQKSGEQSASQQTSGQASGQNPGGQSGNQQQSGQNGSQGAEPAGSQNAAQSTGQSGTSNQSIPANGVSGQGTAGSGGKYSSPWGTQSSSASNSGVVSLEPMPPSSPASSQASQASQSTSGTKIKSQAATNIAGTAPSPKSPTITAGQPSSEFLKIYGEEGSPPPRESLEEIANRYNNRSNGRYGTPGNTGTNSQLNYSNTGKTTAKSQSIKADDGIIKALQARLANETDPEKKKQIQAEIDRLENETK